MAIQLYTGVPGAGKTYKMVADLDAFLKRKFDVNLVSNIKGLQLPHQDFDDMLLHYFPDQSTTILQRIEQFFEYEFQESLNAIYGGPIMYVLDECQEYFPALTKLPNTERYLQRHRHLGHNLYFASQASTLLSSKIVALIEIEIVAVRRSISFIGEFHYRRQSPQTHQLIDSKTVYPRKRVFNLYRSFDTGEIVKPKKALWLRLWPVLLLVLALFYVFGNVLNADKKVERMTGKPRVESHIAPVLPSAVSSTAPVTVTKDVEKERLLAENEMLRRQVSETERVFLTVVQSGDKRLTVDPDTNAVIDVHHVRHKVSCLNDGLTCYYDRPVMGGIRPADASSMGGFGVGAVGLPSSSYLGRATLDAMSSATKLDVVPQLGSGAIIDIDRSMIPAPISYPNKVYDRLGE